MLQNSPQQPPKPESKISPDSTIESVERPPYLDATTLMKEKNCYFVHTIQVTKALDVSENNASIDTRKLTPADRLDILYAANPMVSTSSIRPNKQDGTFYGGFGVIFSQGKIVSATQGDDGTVALSLTKRNISTVYNTEEDVNRAIDRNHTGNGKSYNEIVMEQTEIAGGFMKLSNFLKRLSYEEKTMDYGSGGGEITSKVGVLNLANEKRGASFDTPFAVLLEMKRRGPVYIMDENNQMLVVTDIDEKTRQVEFSTTPTTPADVAEIYGEQKINKYTKEEMKDRLSGRGFSLS
jgi:hypothetical protein